MEKLLHERLREHKRFHEFKFLDGKSTDMLTEYIAREIADEIERYYIPRPRDDDGKPWMFGDEFEYENLHPRCEGYLMFEGEWYLRSQHSQQFKASKCSRPAPKVCDADGVEIKVGDTVWSSMYGDNSFTVERISKNPKGEPLVMVEEMGSGLFPATCYHELPVFDADGVRICKGDTVWHTLTGHKHIVEGFTGDGEIYIDRSSFTWGVATFTHSEPDSLEKLRDEISEAVESWGVDEFDWQLARKWSDRLTSLIERGA